MLNTSVAVVLRESAGCSFSFLTSVCKLQVCTTREDENVIFECDGSSMSIIFLSQSALVNLVTLKGKVSGRIFIKSTFISFARIRRDL